MTRRSVSGPRTEQEDEDEQGLGDDPLAGSDPLVEHFYRPPEAASSEARPAHTTPRRSRSKGRQPLKDGKSFRLVTFSFYEEDVARLDALLLEAKKRGHRRVSRSQLVRLALRQIDLEDLPEFI